MNELKQITAVEIVKNFFKKCGASENFCNCIKNDYELNKRLTQESVNLIVNVDLDYNDTKDPFWIHLLNNNCNELLRLLISEMSINSKLNYQPDKDYDFSKLLNGAGDVPFNGDNEKVIKILQKFVWDNFDKLLNLYLGEILKNNEFNGIIIYKFNKIKIKDSDLRGILINAAESGNLEIVKYLIEDKKVKLSPGPLEVMSDFGIILQYGYDILVDNAAKSGNLELVKYLIENRNFQLTAYTVDNAAKSGNLNMVKYLIEEKRIIPDDATLRYAIKSKNIEILKYLIDEKKVSFRESILRTAAADGNLQIVKYLVEEKGLKPDKITFGNAKYNNDKNVIKYLKNI